VPTYLLVLARSRVRPRSRRSTARLPAALDVRKEHQTHTYWRLGRALLVAAIRAAWYLYLSPAHHGATFSAADARFALAATAALFSLAPVRCVARSPWLTVQRNARLEPEIAGVPRARASRVGRAVASERQRAASRLTRWARVSTRPLTWWQEHCRGKGNGGPRTRAQLARRSSVVHARLFITTR
jgi:hypothetical protein